MKHYARLQDLAALAGQELGHSDWIAIAQDRIDQFAQATGDHQWIHIDPVRAAAGPFGAPIAHGDRKSTRLNSSHPRLSRMPSSA